jgi:hypothetical protein
MCFCICTQDKSQNNNYLNAISPHGVINKVKRPRAPVLSKKRKTAGSTQTFENAKRENVTEYYNFIANAADILYQQE